MFIQTQFLKSGKLIIIKKVKRSWVNGVVGKIEPTTKTSEIESYVSPVRGVVTSRLKEFVLFS